MKRTYMNPTLEVIKIETTQMLAASKTLRWIDGDGTVDTPADILAPSFDFED